MITIGSRFGRLIVLKETKIQNRRKYHRCLCDCGNSKFIMDSNLGKNVNSCGCQKGNIKHHMCYTSEYGIWKGIIQRCTNPNRKNYFQYGGRGINVFDEWKKDFLAFYNYVGPRPSPQYTIDRKENNIGYMPGNIHWATRKEQAQNKRDKRAIEDFSIIELENELSRRSFINYE